MSMTVNTTMAHPIVQTATLAGAGAATKKHPQEARMFSFNSLSAWSGQCPRAVPVTAINAVFTVIFLLRR
jgi:hypothetical protein